MPRLKRAPLALLTTCFQKYGDVFVLPTPKGDIHFFAHPRDVEFVLTHTGKLFGRSERAKSYRPIFGDGRFLSEGAEWARQRRLLQPSFHGQQINAFFGEFSNATEEMLDRWERFAANDEQFDLVREIMALTLEIIVRTMFSEKNRDDGRIVAENFTVLLEHIDKEWMRWFPRTSLFRSQNSLRFDVALATLNEVVFRIIRHGRRRGKGERDLLSALISAVDQDTGKPLGEHELRDQVMSILLAGHETTANALCWTYYLLAQNGAVEQQMFSEVENVIGFRKMALADCAVLPLTRMIFEESMRLFPPGWAITRRVSEDTCVADCKVAKNSTIMLSPYITHRHPVFWDKPEIFEPMRFAGGRSDTRHRFAYLPFSGGPRSCIGKGFALLEAQTILTMIAQRFQVVIRPGVTATPQPMGVLRPKGTIPVRVVRRKRQPGTCKP